MSIHDRHNGIIFCPYDRSRDTRKPHALPKPEKFVGKIYYLTSENGDSISVMNDRLVEDQKSNIQPQRDDTSILLNNETKCENSKTVGSEIGVSYMTA